ncbi:MAG: PEP-CTERM sorting domain-containing protein [Candidatus Omnitrophica bacterium]|nr:PEP-CTERM sorting domain-containing protein [Candidatus Omnitrophota bacterium]
MNIKHILTIALVFVLSWASVAGAGVITGTGAYQPSFPNYDAAYDFFSGNNHPNNDNTSADAADIAAEFVNTDLSFPDLNVRAGLLAFREIVNLDVPLIYQNSGGVTEYTYFNFTANESQRAWHAIEIELGLLDQQGEFRAIEGSGVESLFSGFDFDAPDFDPGPSTHRIVGQADPMRRSYISGPYPSKVNVSDWHLRFSNLNFAATPFDETEAEDLLILIYGVDVPDINFNDPRLAGYTDLAIRHSVTPVPEPASTILFATGILGFAIRRKRS